MNQIISKAQSLATKAHQGLTYGPDDRPYVWHLEKVASLASRLGYQDEIIAACWLHDIVEDTSYTIADLEDDFPPLVTSAVYAVTYVEDSGKDKIQQAKSDVLGHVVKYCDASVNFSASALDGPKPNHTQWEVSVERYPKYLAELHDGLPTPDEVNNYLKQHISEV